jgi:hypothetical protein
MKFFEFALLMNSLHLAAKILSKIDLTFNAGLVRCQTANMLSMPHARLTLHLH